jgi:hypothetical protein
MLKLLNTPIAMLIGNASGLTGNASGKNTSDNG